MKAVGVSRKQFPSSIEALVQRAGKSDVPVSISPLVDFYNAISLKHLVPAGIYLNCNAKAGAKSTKKWPIRENVSENQK